MTRGINDWIQHRSFIKESAPFVVLNLLVMKEYIIRDVLIRVGPLDPDRALQNWNIN